MKNVTLKLIFAGNHNGKVLFARHADDGIFYSVCKNEFTDKLLEAGVYQFEFEQDHAIADVNDDGNVTTLLINGLMLGEPKFLRSVSGKKTHMKLIERKIALVAWLAVNNEG